MSPGYVSSSLRRDIHQRAVGRCEYCLLAEEDAFFPHEPDHIIAEKHGGAATLENLALACFDCNRFKGSDIASIDPDTGSLVALYNRDGGMERTLRIAGRVNCGPDFDRVCDIAALEIELTREGRDAGGAGKTRALSLRPSS